MGMPIIKPDTMTREESVDTIIRSIAAEEPAFAHILNAESEKVQAVIHNPAATEDALMAIHCSVKNAVDHNPHSFKNDA